MIRQNDTKARMSCAIADMYGKSLSSSCHRYTHYHFKMFRGLCCKPAEVTGLRRQPLHIAWTTKRAGSNRVWTPHIKPSHHICKDWMRKRPQKVTMCCMGCLQVDAKLCEWSVCSRGCLHHRMDRQVPSLVPDALVDSGNFAAGARISV